MNNVYMFVQQQYSVQPSIYIYILIYIERGMEISLHGKNVDGIQGVKQTQPTEYTE